VVADAPATIGEDLEVLSCFEPEAEVHDVREFFPFACTLDAFAPSTIRRDFDIPSETVKQGRKPSGGAAGRPGRSAAS
jgi:hypothetical protein